MNLHAVAFVVVSLASPPPSPAPSPSPWVANTPRATAVVEPEVDPHELPPAPVVKRERRSQRLFEGGIGLAAGGGGVIVTALAIAFARGLMCMKGCAQREEPSSTSVAIPVAIGFTGIAIGIPLAIVGGKRVDR